MSVILSLLGIVVAAGGVAAIGFGIPINEFTLGTTLIIVGTTGLTGGLILIGLAAVVSELGRVAEALRTRVVARPPTRPAEAAEPVAAAAVASAPAVAAGVRPTRPTMPIPPQPTLEAPVREPRPAEPHPAPASSAVDVSAAAIERLRSSIPRTERPKAEPSIVADDEEVPLSPNGAAHHQTQQPRPAAVEGVPPAKGAADDRAGGAAVEALKASRLDFLFRSKPVRPAAQPENFDSFWPAEARSGRSVESEARPAVEEVQTDEASPVQDRGPEAAPVEEPHTAAILKSGVVDGMAYTLYADGSIEAKLPHGTVRFGSIAELRAHIESKS